MCKKVKSFSLQMSLTLSKLKDFIFLLFALFVLIKNINIKKHQKNVIKASRYMQKCDKYVQNGYESVIKTLKIVTKV